jgi:hypothetical protein
MKRPHMPVTGTRVPSPWTRGIAAVLLVLQAGASGAVAVAHAEDPLGGAITLESHHGPQCVLLHDAARCPQCQFHASRTLAPPRRVRLSLNAQRLAPGPDRARRTPVRPRLRSSSPRAPPALLA